MKIYQNSTEPIYKQIAAQLREQILMGKLKAGDPLPSIRGLAQDLKISVITTMKAYEELSSEVCNYLHRVNLCRRNTRKGRG